MADPPNRPDQRLYVAVVGTSTPDEAVANVAEEVGRRIAERDGVLLCGGLGGVMEAAARGAKAAGGTTVGILPGERAVANAYLDVALETGLGEIRNALLVRASDVVVALGGGHGTLSEIAFALRTGKPVVGLDTWTLSPPDGSGAPPQGIVRAESAAEAVDVAWRLATAPA